MNANYMNIPLPDESEIQTAVDTHALTHKTIKTVYIPACVEHDGIMGMYVKLFWNCPVCGKPRGEIVDNVRSYDGSRILYCDGWYNPCGHIDKYSDVRHEAYTNDLNQ
jgi:hypothetical protein